jgi:tetratricopeptide (TPR) repeat protein
MLGMTSGAEPTGSLETALAHTRRLLDSNPVLAAEQAGEILKVVPNHPPATLLLAMARRMTGAAPEAIDILERLADAQPNWAAAHYELGTALADAGQSASALAALRRAVTLNPAMPDAWRAIADHLMLNGERQGADAAYAQHIKASTRDPRLLSAAAALVDGRIAPAEASLRAHLKHYPTDVAAIRMLAEVAARLGRNADAEVLLTRCLELMPSFEAARHQYAIVLHRQNKSAAALSQVEQLSKLRPHNPIYQNLRAVVLTKMGEYRESLEVYAEVLKALPDHAKIWMSYGHTLATAGREEESIAAYRKSIELAPHLGEAYWSLANLKTFRFAPDEVSAMRTQLAGGGLKDEDRYHFDFALGKALEDSGDYAESFSHYVRANELRRAEVNYEAEESTAFVRRSKELFSADFFAKRANYGSQAPDPIFIVGMPRAGSTLIEQMLASHSSVEGTMELPDIIMMAATLAGVKKPGAEPRYPGLLANLSRETCRELGEQYIEQTRIQRKSVKPLFIDKMPNNFLHIGLIHLVLPRARIIDARRHPMACCFSGFKQQFAEGHRYSYSLKDIGRYYRDYRKYMEHFDGVLPGRVCRVNYEAMIGDPEREVRRLLEYCQLPFESACLRFYDNDRPVRTASSQQVRKPIYRDGVDHWRRYETWLQPLRQALGDALDDDP